MPKPLVNSEATKTEGTIISDAPAEQKIERVADEAAEKSTKTEQRYDKDHNIFSK